MRVTASLLPHRPRRLLWGRERVEVVYTGDIRIVDFLIWPQVGGLYVDLILFDTHTRIDRLALDCTCMRFCAPPYRER